MQGKKKASRWRYLPGLAALTIATILLVVFLANLGSLNSPAEEPCEQGRVLRSAQLLDKAEAAYRQAEAGDRTCPQPPATATGASQPAPLEGIERAQRKAKEAFTEARVRSGGGELLLALRAYLKGLEINPFEGERNELEKALGEFVKGAPADQAAAKSRCSLGEELTQAGLPANATKALAGGMAMAPKDCQSALTTLQHRVADADEYAAQAATLTDAAEQRREYVLALRENAELGSAREALEASFDDESTLTAISSWLGGIFKTLEGALSWLAPLAIGLLLAALVLWILLDRVGRRTRGRRALAQIGTWWGFSFLRKAALPKLAVEDFDGKGDGIEGKDFSALLTLALPKRVGREPSFAFDSFTKGAPSGNAANEVATVLSAVSATKALGGFAEVLLKLFRRRTISISGRLQPIGDRGAGLTLTIAGAVNTSIELRDSSIDFHPSGNDGARWLRLLPAAAIWCRWQLAPIYADVDADFDPEGWKGEALFQSGIAWEGQGDWPRARDLYVSALESDHDLLTAIHNLAILDIFHFQRYEAAQVLVERVQGKLDGNKKLEAQWPALKAASLYTKALAWVYPEIDQSGHGQTGDLEKGWRSACEMVEELAQKIEDDSLGDSEREALANTEGFSVVLLANYKARRFPQIARAAAARVGGQTASIGREKLCREAADLDPWELIEGYVLGPLQAERETGRITHYNLACYFAMLSEHAESEAARRNCSRRALESLEAALIGGAQAEWADADPELQALKKSNPDEFKKLIDANRVSKPEETKKSDGDSSSGTSPKGIGDLLRELGAWLKKRLGR
jgi:hypothetical protein